MAFGHVTELHRFARNGHGVVADALEDDIGADHRRYQAQMARARQMNGDEGVTQAVDPAHVPVDRQVRLEDELVDRIGSHAVGQHLLVT